MCESQKYIILISDKLNGLTLKLSEFSDLDIMYIKGYNNTGNLNLTLKINNQLITLSSDMKDDIIIDNYKIKGLSSLVKSKSEIYLIVLIEKCQIENSHFDVKHLNQPFILEFHDNPTTGYSWNLQVTPGIKIIKDSYSSKCEEGMTGCGGIRTYLLEGIKRGNQEIIATHGRPWDPTTNTRYLYKYNII
jgi:predicted secreted protein